MPCDRPLGFRHRATRSELRILDLLEALRSPPQLPRRLIVHPLRVLRKPQLILLVLAHLLPLHQILPQNLRNALRVLDGLRGLRGAGLEAAVLDEGLAGELQGGGVDFGVA